MKDILLEKARELGYLKKTSETALSSEDIEDIENYPFVTAEQMQKILEVEQQAIDYQSDVMRFFEEVIFNNGNNDSK